MLKKGQTAIFIIIGIIIIAGFLFALYIREQVAKQTIESQTGVTSDFAIPVKNFVQSCLESSSKNAVLIAEQQGGFFLGNGTNTKFTPVLFPSSFITVPIYYEPTGASVPSKETVQKELESFIDYNMKNCVDYFIPFQIEGIGVEDGKRTISVSLSENSINVKMDYPVTLTKGDTSVTINDYATSFKTDLVNRLNAASEYINAQAEVPDALRIKHLMDISEKHNVTFETVPAGNIVIFTFLNNNIKIGNDVEIFNFAVDYGNINRTI